MEEPNTSDLPNQQAADQASSSILEFSLIDTLQTIVAGWKTIVWYAVAAAILGLVYAVLFTPTRYTANAVILPLNQAPEGGASKLLKQFGGLGGIDLGGMSGEQVPPSLFPNIVGSTPCQLYLMEQEIPFSELDTTLRIYDYLSDYEERSVGEVIKAYTIGLPEKLKSLFTASEEAGIPQAVVETDGPLRLSKHQQNLIKQLRNTISIALDDELGTMHISVEWRDPKATAALAHLTLEYLMDYTISYQIEKERDNLEFVEGRHAEAKARFHAAQDKLAVFDDGTQNIALQRLKTERDRLQAEYSLSYDLYNSLAQQVESARIRVQEQTPSFKILEPVIVPTDKSSVRKKSVIMAAAVLGIVVGLFRVLYGTYLMSFVRMILKRE